MPRLSASSIAQMARVTSSGGVSPRKAIIVTFRHHLELPSLRRWQKLYISLCLRLSLHLSLCVSISLASVYLRLSSLYFFCQSMCHDCACADTISLPNSVAWKHQKKRSINGPPLLPARAHLSPPPTFSGSVRHIGMGRSAHQGVASTGRAIRRLPRALRGPLLRRGSSGVPRRDVGRRDRRGVKRISGGEERQRRRDRRE